MNRNGLIQGEDKHGRQTGNHSHGHIEQSHPPSNHVHQTDGLVGEMMASVHMKYKSTRFTPQNKIYDVFFSLNTDVLMEQRRQVKGERHINKALTVRGQAEFRFQDFKVFRYMTT